MTYMAPVSDQIINCLPADNIQVSPWCKPKQNRPESILMISLRSPSLVDRLSKELPPLLGHPLDHPLEPDPLAWQTASRIDEVCRDRHLE